MLLTVDIFAGRKNRTWSIPTEVGARILDLTLKSRQNITPFANEIPSRLGYRGIRMELRSPLLLQNSPFGRFYVSAESFLHTAYLAELAIILDVAKVLHDLLALLKRVLRMLIDALTSSKAAPPVSTACAFEMPAYDPGFWNDPAHIELNNCYAYASNKRTDTFPQPGRGGGLEITDMSCSAAVAASKLDGAHDAGDCFPDSEAPRLLVALVIWPGEDYHWYRRHPDFWGHKPGQTAARNIDNSGKIIVDPKTCDRGPYTDFCGFFLLPKSQKVM
jgi:hypothetical protein